MADSLRFGNFQLDRSGVIEVTKSGAVASALGSLATSMARRANAEASTRSTTGEQGMRDQALNHTLDSLNH